MIGVIFEFAGEMIEIRVDKNRVYFRRAATPWATIEGLKLSKTGVIKEFPDLSLSDNWREIAINRFKEKIKSFKTEEEKVDYVIDDLRKHGYIPKAMQKQGFRVKKIK